MSKSQEIEGDSDTSFDVFSTDNGDYYIRNMSVIADITHSVLEGHYCTILGPRYCQKSLLLNDVRIELEEKRERLCALVDLHKLRTVADRNFLSSFATLISQRVQERNKTNAPASLVEVANERSLQRFLQDYVQKLGQELVLLVDHLERIRIGPLESLLRALRAVYTERSPDDPYGLGLVTAGSLSVAELALSRSSLFNIAQSVWVRDLTSVESEKLIQHTLRQKQVEMTRGGLERLLWATDGDRYLLRYLLNALCDQYSKLAEEGQGTTIAEQEVAEAVESFLKERAEDYPPLRETVRALENDPVMLMNVLKILQQDRMLSQELRLELDPYSYKLRLTGAVNVGECEDEKAYRIRNEIYYRYLEKHFHHRRVVHVLSMAGRWEESITHLERVVANDSRYRSTLLGTIIDSIYAARSEAEAYNHLAQRLSRAFSIPETRVYIVNPERSQLRLVSQVGFEEQETRDLSLDEGDQPEVAAYFSQHYEVFHGASGEPIIMVPLLRNESERLGLVVVHGLNADPQENDFLELLTFLTQVGRAIGNVIQMTTLYELGRKVTSSLDLEQVSKATVEAAIKAVPGAQRGVLFLWNEKEQKLLIEYQKGYRPSISREIRLGKREGYVGLVHATRKPMRIWNVLADPRVLLKEDPDIKKQLSVICVPLEVRDRVLGVLLVDNTASSDAFKESDLELLSTLGAQAAVAIQNAQLNRELHDFGMEINCGSLSSRDILRKAVESIIRVSGATAANILLLSDTEDAELSVAQKLILSVASQSLGPDYESTIMPREKGLTYLVLKHREPWCVNKPEDYPGINDLARKQGTQSYLCLPSRIKEQIIGVLFVHYDKPHTFSDDEIKMLALFANQAALAIENTRQREELALTDEVTWMGLLFPSLAHRVTQETAAILNTVWKLRQLFTERDDVLERLDRILEYIGLVGEIHKKALTTPFQNESREGNLNEIVRDELGRWFAREGIDPDFSQLTAEDSTVRANKEGLKFVLETLARNALRAMEHTKDKTLIVTSEVGGGRRRKVTVSVTNSGREIPDDVRGKLFKVPIEKGDGQGAGVGLLIARRIVRRYRGDIELVRSDPSGTTFKFWLPLYPDSSE